MTEALETTERHAMEVRNDLIRKIVQVCATCSNGQGKGRGLVCNRKRGCHSKRVTKWLKELQEIDSKKEVIYETH